MFNDSGTSPLIVPTCSRDGTKWAPPQNCDNLQALTAFTAHADGDLPVSERVNHAYAHTALKPLLPVLLLGGKVSRKVKKMLRDVLDLIAGRTYRHKENVSKPRKQDRKPHNSMTQKNC